MRNTCFKVFDDMSEAELVVCLCPEFGVSRLVLSARELDETVLNVST